MAKRVFVTGAGIVSALGIGKGATLQALQNGVSGVGKLTHIESELSSFPVGEVQMDNAQLSRMLGVEYPVSEVRTALLAIAAAREAVAEANLTDKDFRKCAFISGTTVGGMDKTERHFKNVIDADLATDETRELKYNDCGYSTEMTADAIGNFGMVTTSSTACSSAANAVILGANLIKAGVVDIAVVGGSEALSKFHINGFNTLMILDSERCRPFDRDRAGINLGEGAGFLVIESEESAARRKVSPIGELIGYANACDAFHQTATSETGEGAFRSMTSALAMANLAPETVDYVNAHGTGTPNNDETELAAMKRVWGNKLPFFSSTKPFTGHTTSASGSIESVISLLAIKHGFIPPNLGWSNPISAGAEPVTGGGRNSEVKIVVNNSFGFGGNDSTLIFAKV